MHSENQKNDFYNIILCYAKILVDFFGQNRRNYFYIFHISAKIDVSQDGKWPKIHIDKETLFLRIFCWHQQKSDDVRISMHFF